MGSDTDLRAHFVAWLIDGSCWTIDRSCIGYGLRLLYLMCYGAGRLARCEAKKGKEEKHGLRHGLQGVLLRLAHQRIMLDPRLLLHRLQTSMRHTTRHGAGCFARC